MGNVVNGCFASFRINENFSKTPRKDFPERVVDFMMRGCLQNATQIEGSKLVTRKPVHGGWLDTSLTKKIERVLL